MKYIITLITLAAIGGCMWMDTTEDGQPRKNCVVVFGVTAEGC